MDIDAARNAAMHFRWASDQLRDYAVLKAEQIEHPDKLTLAENNIRIAARTLGFDLVRRVTPQQAHEAMLATRRAEDGPDCSSIGAGRV